MFLMIDFREICSSLSDRFPQWTDRIRLLEFQDVPGVLPVDNDGRIIYYNGRLLQYYTPESQTFYAAQQLLHLQLNHYARGAGKNPRVWKRASDAVVNSMLREDGFVLPADAVLPADFTPHSAESLYELFLEQEEKDPEQQDPDPEEKDPAAEAALSTDKRAGKNGDSHSREIRDPGLASVISGLSEMLEPSMQLDSDWFPGTTIRDGVLHYDFRPYPVAHAEILLDTSASVDSDLLRAFVRGVKGIFRQDAVIRVGCFDTRFYGFQDVHSEEDIRNLELIGSGGTDFHTAVHAFTGDAENRIILTDGFAEMPEERCDAIWVVYGNATIHPPGGRVLYVRPTEEAEKHEIDFLIT